MIKVIYMPFKTFTKFIGGLRESSCVSEAIK